MFYPLKFHPLFIERLWGGRELERLLRKPLPAKIPIGESWEIADRSPDVSIIANGRYTGKTLRWLLEHYPVEILGSSSLATSSDMPVQFPLLIKYLDAHDRLSVQVHPPPAVAKKLGGHSKTEMWRVVQAAPDAGLYMGLRRGVTRDQFRAALADGTVADLLHRVPAKQGDMFFIPSGRVHALGAGIVVLEIQENSDTTYRVFDWNRKDAVGNSRELHIEQALQSIDFNDYEPAPLAIGKPPTTADDVTAPAVIIPVIACPYFTATHVTLRGSCSDRCDGTYFQLLVQINGASLIASRTVPPHEGYQETLDTGDIVLLPAALGDFRVEPRDTPCELLKITPF